MLLMMTMPHSTEAYRRLVLTIRMSYIIKIMAKLVFYNVRWHDRIMIWTVFVSYTYPNLALVILSLLLRLYTVALQWMRSSSQFTTNRRPSPSPSAIPILLHPLQRSPVRAARPGVSVIHSFLTGHSSSLVWVSR